MYLVQDEVNESAGAWSARVLGHCRRLLHSDAFRGSHNGVIRAAALQTLAALTAAPDAVASAPADPLDPLDPSPACPLGQSAVGPAAEVLRFAGTGEPELVRAVALVGAAQLLAARADAAAAVAGLAHALAAVFVDGASGWLRLTVVTGLAQWLGGFAGPGGLLADQGLLFSDQRTNGLAGGFCPAWRAAYAKDSAAHRPSPRQASGAKLCLDLVRGAW